MDPTPDLSQAALHHKRLYRSALAENPRHAEAMRLLGLLLFQRGAAFDADRE